MGSLVRVMMDYPCDKFGDCRFSRFGLSCGQTEKRDTDADDRYTHATFVDVSNNCDKNMLIILLCVYFYCCVMRINTRYTII